MINENQITEKRTNTILNFLQEKHFMNYADEYGERGYTNPEKSILFANWNDISDTVQEYLELAGYELEWGDEWVIDYDNSKAYRISGNSCDWQCQVHYTECGELLTPDDDLSEWVDEFCLTDYAQPIKALSNDIAEKDGGLIALGYTLLNDPEKETGYHAGQNDDPAKEAKHYFETIDDLESIVFVISEASQFYIKWNIYGLISE